MTQLIILVTAIYAIAVGYHGNGATLFQQLGADLPGFAPWFVAILILGLLAVNENTAELGRPLLLLIALGLILKDWPKIQSNGRAAYSALTGAASPATTTGS